MNKIFGSPSLENQKRRLTYSRLIRYKITHLPILCLIFYLAVNCAFASDSYSRRMRQQDLTSFSEKIRLENKLSPPLESKITEMPALHPTTIPTHKSITDIKESRIKPSYGKEKAEKKKPKVFDANQFKFDKIIFRYLEVLLIVMILTFFVKRELKRIKRKELEKKSESS